MAKKGRPQKFQKDTIRGIVNRLTYADIKSPRKQNEVFKSLSAGLGKTYSQQVKSMVNKRAKVLRGIEIESRLLKRNPHAKGVFYDLQGGKVPLTVKKAKRVSSEYRALQTSYNKVIKAYGRLDVFKGMKKSAIEDFTAGMNKGTDKEQAFFAMKILQARLEGEQGEVDYWMNEYKKQVIEGGGRFYKGKKNYLVDAKSIEKTLSELGIELPVPEDAFMKTGSDRYRQAQEDEFKEKQTKIWKLFEEKKPNVLWDKALDAMTTTRTRDEMNREKMKRQKEWKEFAQRNRPTPKTSKPKK